MCTNFLLEFPTPLVEGAPLRISTRTLELAGHMATNLYLVPRGQAFPVGGPLKELQNPLEWTNDFGFVAIASPGTERLVFMDGLNEKGLSAAALWMPGTVYPTDASASQVAFGDLCGWILGKFHRVAHLVESLKKINVWGPLEGAAGYAPLHFIATDATGASVVIELIGGEMNIHGPDETTSDGVLANAPTYDWHRANLLNYANLNVVGPETSVIMSGPPVGNGLCGMPGDPMSASRFVRAATMRKGFGMLPPNGDGWLPAPGGVTTGTSGTEQTAATVAMQLSLVVMATPYGTVLSQKEGARPMVGDWTMWAVARDHSNRKLYFSSAFNGIMRVIDLNTLNFDPSPTPIQGFSSIPLLPAPADFAWVEDVTKRLA